MIARCAKGIDKALENRAFVVMDLRCLPVHDLIRANDARAERFRDHLVA